MEYKSEAALQAKCTMLFRRLYLDQYFRLHLIFNNPPNPRMAGVLKSLGLNRGIADQVYFSPIGIVVWIDYKNEKGRQSEEQKMFQNMVESYGHKYVLIYNETQFLDTIKMYNYGE